MTTLEEKCHQERRTKITLFRLCLFNTKITETSWSFFVLQFLQSKTVTSCNLS